MRIYRIVAAGCLCAAAAFPGVADDVFDLQAGMVSKLNEFRDRYGFPGATAAVALPDGRIVVAASGLADVEAGRPMTSETPMLAASIGKTFVAAAVLALESERVLSQGHRLADYLGKRPWYPGLPNANMITIGHLLHHQSGLPDHTQLPEFQAAARARIAAGGDAFSPEELVGFVTGREALFDAGSAWAYSDTGYVLLGLVIEEATGRPFYDVLRGLFLDPFDLGATIPSDRPDISGLAVGYTVLNNPFGLPERTADADGRLVWDPGLEWAGGGHASTSRDLARWGHLLFGGTAMERPYLMRLLDGVPMAPDGRRILYGAGVAIYTETLRGPVFGHGGWIPGYLSSLRHYADHGITVTFQINSDAGVVDDSSDVVPALEAALADLAIEATR